MENRFESLYNTLFEAKKIYEPIWTPRWKLVIIRDIYQTKESIPTIVVKAESAKDAWRYFEAKRMKNYPGIAELYKYNKGDFTFHFVPTDDLDHLEVKRNKELEKNPPRLPYNDD